MTKIVIRDADVADAEAVLGVHVRARTAYYQGFLPEEQLAADNERDPAAYATAITSPNRIVRCAEVDGAVVGFVILGPCYHPDPDPAVGHELYQIHVEPARFRTGVGSRLHDAALSAWRDRGISLARLWVWEFNERALAFYARRGWTADGHERPDRPRVGTHRMIGLVRPVG
jgi:ribosomal protein S18 acetylase RimI-like enzyme